MGGEADLRSAHILDLNNGEARANPMQAKSMNSQQHRLNDPGGLAPKRQSIPHTWVAKSSTKQQFSRESLNSVGDLKLDLNNGEA